MVVSAGVAIISVGLISCESVGTLDDGVDKRQIGQSSMANRLTDKEVIMLKNWRGHSYSTEVAGKVAGICLKRKLRKAQVIKLIGLPPSDSGTRISSPYEAPSK